MLPFVALMFKTQPVPIPTSVGSYVMGDYHVISWTQGGVGCATAVYLQVDGTYELRDTLGIDVTTSNPGFVADGMTAYYIGVRHFRGTRGSEMVTIAVGP